MFLKVFYIKYAQKTLEKLWGLFFEPNFWIFCTKPNHVWMLHLDNNSKDTFKITDNKIWGKQYKKDVQIKKKYLGYGLISHKVSLLDKICITPTLFRRLKLENILFIHFSLLLHFIYKQVIWYALQMKGLASV